MIQPLTGVEKIFNSFFTRFSLKISFINLFPIHFIDRRHLFNIRGSKSILQNALVSTRLIRITILNRKSTQASISVQHLRIESSLLHFFLHLQLWRNSCYFPLHFCFASCIIFSYCRCVYLLSRKPRLQASWPTRRISRTRECPSKESSFFEML